MGGVTCIMPTADRRQFVPAAIRLFLKQDYEPKELVIVDDGADRVEDLVPVHLQIRYAELSHRARLGTKRNVACEAASGDIIVHWDDDDWHAPWRLRYQVEALQRNELDVCGLDRVLFVNSGTGQAWEYVHPPNPVRWVCGATLAYRKAFWQSHPFAEVDRGEDSRFVFAARGTGIGVLEDNRFYVGRIHRHNSCPKSTRSAPWHERPIELIRALVGTDWDTVFGGL